MFHMTELNNKQINVMDIHYTLVSGGHSYCLYDVKFKTRFAFDRNTAMGQKVSERCDTIKNYLRCQLPPAN